VLWCAASGADEFCQRQGWNKLPARILGLREMKQVDGGGTDILTVFKMCAQIFQNSRNHLKILGARGVTYSMFHEDPTKLGATVQN
jgi:hypothetical protein